MSEQKKFTKIEDAIVEYLDGDLKETALKLTTYLNESDDLSLVLLPWELDKGKTIAFKIKHNEHYIGWILIKDNGEWLFDNWVSFKNASAYEYPLYGSDATNT